MQLKNKEQKLRNLKLRLTELEFSFVKEKAKEAHLSISDYQRCKLFDEYNVNPRNSANDTPAIDSKSRFACDHDKEMMRVIFRMYLYTRELVILKCGDKEYERINELAKLQLKEWNYE